MTRRERALRVLCRQHPGWRLERRRKGWRLIGPDGALVAVSWTPSSRRYLRLVEADMRRAGRDRDRRPGL